MNINVKYLLLYIMLNVRIELNEMLCCKLYNDILYNIII